MWCFVINECDSSTLMPEAAGSSKPSVHFYQTTPCNNSEHSHHRKNLQPPQHSNNYDIDIKTVTRYHNAEVLASTAKCFIHYISLFHIHKPSLLTDSKHGVTFRICPHHIVETACCTFHMYTSLTKLKHMHDMCIITSEDPSTIFTRIWDNPPSQSSVFRNTPKCNMSNF